MTGVDYDAVALGTISYNTDNNGGLTSVTISEALMQEWIDNPLGNAGLLFVRAAKDSSSQILGSFTGTGANGPELKFALATVPEASAGMLVMATIAFGTAFAMNAVNRRRNRK